MRAGIALGSNLGDRLRNLKNAREAVGALAIDRKVIASSIYETDPVDCEADAAQFYNAVLEIEHSGSARELLRQLRAIEEQMGRPAKHRRNVSRSIDLDLLYFGDEQIDTPELRLPHPRLQERRFVLEPLAEIRPDLVLPNQRRSIRDLLAPVDCPGRVVRAYEQW